MHFAALDRDDIQRRQARFAAGIGLSLVLHALLLALWHNNPMHLPEESEPPRSIAVWLRPLVPKLTKPAPPAAAEPSEPRSRHRAMPGTRRRAAPSAPQAPAGHDEAVVQDELSIPPASPARPESAPGPRFDVDAARRFARRIAADPDPARRATAVGQFPEPPLQTESRAARAIGAAKRANCKDGLPGGLLAPLFLMLDKKDSGCKW
jgi:hypothetical protein